MPAVLFVGGGTGGHIYPNVAIAERLGTLDGGSDVRFLISNRPGDARILDGLGYPATAIDVRPLPPATKPWRSVGFLRTWRASLRETSRLLADADIRVVVATGGFVSGPAVVAARRAGIPTALVNLDAVPGFANRHLSRFASVTFSAYRSERLPDAEPIGIPLRRAGRAELAPAEARRRLGLDPDLHTLFVTGATHGGGSMIAAIRHLVTDASVRTTLRRWQVLHQCGTYDPIPLQRDYDAAGIPAVVVPFLDEMGAAWASADLAIARAGASTVAEAWANTIPTIFLPNPHHPHQRLGHNTRPLVDAGGAAVVADEPDSGQTAQRLAAILRELLEEPRQRAAMRDALARTEPADGSDAVATWVRCQVGPGPR